MFRARRARQAALATQSGEERAHRRALAARRIEHDEVPILLPPDAPEARAAQDEAEAMRRQLLERAAIRQAAE